MWSLDWFQARSIAATGAPVRRVAWTHPTWLVYTTGIWWRHTGSQWEVETTDFTEEDFRARDWTNENYGSSTCGTLPAHNTAPVARRGWGDRDEMRPVPVPGYPEDIPEEFE